jgi:hypothetical protein
MTSGDGRSAYITSGDYGLAIQGGWDAVVSRNVTVNEELKANTNNGYIPTGKIDKLGCLSIARTPGGSNYVDDARIFSIYTYDFHNYSQEEGKKNFEKLENALDIVKATDIYKYNYKQEKDGTKKRIGLVIGDNYNYAKEITDRENEGVDLYSMTSVCLQAIKEQQAQIEKLKEEINKLKGEK